MPRLSRASLLFLGVWIAPVALLSGADAHASMAGSKITPQYDSVQQIILDGQIDDGLILVRAGKEDSAEAQIREQLRYSLGQLNYVDAAPKVSWFKIQIVGEEEDEEDSDRIVVHYRAQGHIAWSKKESIPDEFELILPARADSSGLESFADRYFRRCTNDPHATREGFYYYYFPRMRGCPMRDDSDAELEAEQGHVVRFGMKLSPSQTNTRDKSPEYGKIWEDGKLVVSAIFGKYEPDAVSDADQGIAQYNRFYWLVRSRYGRPSYINHHFGGAPGARYPKVEMIFDRGGREIDIRMTLIGGWTEVDDEFIDWYERRTRVSDLVIYNGHAGGGDNVQAMAQYGKFTPGQYQIFLVNGCDTFTYLNERLFAAHAAANPGSPPSRFLDIITNSMSNHFSKMADESMLLIRAMERKKKTYHEILRGFEPFQRAIVDGEEDNRWPNEFD